MEEKANSCYLCGCEDVERYDWKMGDLSKPKDCEAYGIRREVNCSDCGNYEISSFATCAYEIKIVRDDAQLLRDLRKKIAASTEKGERYFVEFPIIASARKRLV